MFLKIHAPADVLRTNADIVGVLPPVKEFSVTFYASELQKNGSEKVEPSIMHASKVRFKFRNEYFQDEGECSTMIDRFRKTFNLNCATIPPEPSIFFPGLLPDILDKYTRKKKSIIASWHLTIHNLCIELKVRWEREIRSIFERAKEPHRVADTLQGGLR